MAWIDYSYYGYIEDDQTGQKLWDMGNGNFMDYGTMQMVSDPRIATTSEPAPDYNTMDFSDWYNQTYGTGSYESEAQRYAELDTSGQLSDYESLYGEFPDDPAAQEEWFESAVAGGRQEQAAQALADEDFFDDPIGSIVEPVAEAIDPIAETAMDVFDQLDQFIPDTLEGAIGLFASLFSGPIVSQLASSLGITTAQASALYGAASSAAQGGDPVAGAFLSYAGSVSIPQIASATGLTTTQAGTLFNTAVTTLTGGDPTVGLIMGAAKSLPDMYAKFTGSTATDATSTSEPTPEQVPVGDESQWYEQPEYVEPYVEQVSEQVPTVTVTPTPDESMWYPEAPAEPYVAQIPEVPRVEVTGTQPAGDEAQWYPPDPIQEPYVAPGEVPRVEVTGTQPAGDESLWYPPEESVPRLTITEPPPAEEIPRVTITGQQEEVPRVTIVGQQEEVPRVTITGEQPTATPVTEPTPTPTEVPYYRPFVDTTAGSRLGAGLRGAGGDGGQGASYMRESIAENESPGNFLGAAEDAAFNNFIAEQGASRLNKAKQMAAQLRFGRQQSPFGFGV